MCIVCPNLVFLCRTILLRDRDFSTPHSLEKAVGARFPATSVQATRQAGKADILKMFHLLRDEFAERLGPASYCVTRNLSGVAKNSSQHRYWYLGGKVILWFQLTVWTFYIELPGVPISHYTGWEKSLCLSDSNLPRTYSWNLTVPICAASMKWLIIAKV